MGELLLRIYQNWDNKMSEIKLEKFAKDAEKLELNDLIKIKKILDEAVAKQRNYDDVVITRQGAPYYT